MTNVQAVEFASLGAIRFESKQYESAASFLVRAASIEPHPLYRLNLASALCHSGRPEQAQEIAGALLEQHPDLAGAWSVLGLSRLMQGSVEDARNAYAMACQYDERNLQYRTDYIACLMLLGDWEQGWKLSECRYPMIGYQPSLPMWDGSADKHVLVVSEQGAGDTIQFARYIQQLAATKCRKVTFAVPRTMASLFSRHPCDIVLKGQVPQDADAEVALHSLPYLFDTSPDNVPADPGLLAYADAPPVASRGGLKVGICWAGNPEHQRDHMRSAPFDAFMPLTAEPGMDIYSFQCGPHSADIARAGVQALVADLSPTIEPKWSAAASLMRQMDAVVTVDTAVAHLAGALGIPTCLLVACAPDWRWLVSAGSRTPWYPSMHIIRQRTALQWGPEMADAVAWCRTLARAKSVAQTGT